MRVLFTGVSISSAFYHHEPTQILSLRPRTHLCSRTRSHGGRGLHIRPLLVSSKALAHRLDFDAEQPPAKRMKMGPPSRPARIPHSSIMRLLPLRRPRRRRILSLYRHLAPSSTCHSLYRRLAPSSSPSSSSSSTSIRRSTKTSRRRSPVGMSAATGRDPLELHAPRSSLRKPSSSSTSTPGHGRGEEGARGVEFAMPRWASQSARAQSQQQC
ncbi:hypothetical protein B0H13DRAFT_2672746, partial [Mycena leptocephala]